MKKAFLLLTLLSIFLNLNVYSQNSFEDFHKIVKTIKPNNQSFQQISDKLAKYAKDDFDKAKLIYLWVAEHIDYDVVGLRTFRLPDGSPEVTLKRKKAVCDGYARLFKAMAVYLGLDADLVSGYSKNHKKAKVSKESNHSWNIVRINNRNILIDATWGAGNTYGDKFIDNTNYYYFDTDPYEFVFTHVPELEKHQFLDNPVSLEEYKKMPYVDNYLFKHNIITGKEILRYFRNNKNLNLPTVYNSDIEFNILKAPYEVKVGNTYDFIIDSKEIKNLEVFLTGKKTQRISKSENGYFEFSVKSTNKGIVKVSMITKENSSYTYTVPIFFCKTKD